MRSTSREPGDQFSHRDVCVRTFTMLVGIVRSVRVLDSGAHGSGVVRCRRGREMDGRAGRSHADHQFRRGCWRESARPCDFLSRALITCWVSWPRARRPPCKKKHQKPVQGAARAGPDSHLHLHVSVRVRGRIARRRGGGERRGEGGVHEVIKVPGSVGRRRGRRPLV